MSALSSSLPVAQEINCAAVADEVSMRLPASDHRHTRHVMGDAAGTGDGLGMIGAHGDDPALVGGAFREGLIQRANGFGRRFAGDMLGDFVDNAVRESAKRTALLIAAKSKIVADLVKAGKVKVVAARYDLDDGKAEFLS